LCVGLLLFFYQRIIQYGVDSLLKPYCMLRW